MNKEKPIVVCENMQEYDERVNEIFKKHRENLKDSSKKGSDFLGKNNADNS